MRAQACHSASLSCFPCSHQHCGVEKFNPTVLLGNTASLCVLHRMLAVLEDKAASPFPFGQTGLRGRPCLIPAPVLMAPSGRREAPHRPASGASRVKTGRGLSEELTPSKAKHQSCVGFKLLRTRRHKKKLPWSLLCLTFSLPPPPSQHILHHTQPPRGPSAGAGRYQMPGAFRSRLTK